MGAELARVLCFLAHCHYLILVPLLGALASGAKARCVQVRGALCSVSCFWPL